MRTLIMEAVKKIFGIALICRAAVCDKTLEAMQETAEQTDLADRIAEAKSFKVETKRGTSVFRLLIQVCRERLRANPAAEDENLKPDMHTPELTIHLEIRDQHAFVHAGPEPGAGGMPVGTNGRAAMLLRRIDSPVAGYMMSKRGLELVAIHFFSYPIPRSAPRKGNRTGGNYDPYTGRMPLLVVPFTKIQEAIRDNCHEELFTLIMRRFMMRIAEKLAVREGCGGLITGESLGQVASALSCSPWRLRERFAACRYSVR